MKRYHVAIFLIALSAASFVGGFELQQTYALVVPAQPTTLSVQTHSGLFTVRGGYSAVHFGSDGKSSVDLYYESDRFFCDGFDAQPDCYRVLP